MFTFNGINSSMNKDERLAELTYQVYLDLINGKIIDYKIEYTTTPGSLKNTFDLMNWYDLGDEFQRLINKVFSGEMTAYEFKCLASAAIAKEIAKEIQQKAEDELFEAGL